MLDADQLAAAARRRIEARGEWERVDGQSDVWAVGATMFYVLARRPVHLGETVSAQLVLAGTSSAPTLSSVSTSVPDAVCALVDRALAFEKSDRARGSTLTLFTRRTEGARDHGALGLSRRWRIDDGWHRIAWLGGLGPSKAG